MTIPKLTILKTEDNPETYIKQRFSIELDMEYPEDRIVGIDPGTVHLGIASIYPKNDINPNGFVSLLEMNIPRPPRTQDRIRIIWYILNDYNLSSRIDKLIIEGASYADRYRQIELQDIRAGGISWMMKQYRNYEADIIPPLTIRKTVFGSAKIKNPWEEQGIPNNAAAALACALYPIMKERNEK